MSCVIVWLGTMLLSLHVLPPSVERNTGAKFPRSGSGVNAVPTIWSTFFGLTASEGSLSCSVSSLSDRGIILTSNSRPPPGKAAAEPARARVLVREAERLRPSARPLPLRLRLLTFAMRALLQSGYEPSSVTRGGGFCGGVWL